MTRNSKTYGIVFYLAAAVASVVAIGTPFDPVASRVMLNQCGVSGSIPAFRASRLIPSNLPNAYTAIIANAVDLAGDAYTKANNLDTNPKTDLVVLGSGAASNKVYILKNPTLTSLGSVLTFTLGTTPLLALKSADLDNNGKLDVIAVNPTTIYFLWQETSGAFTSSSKSAGNFLLSGLSIGDYNGDSRLDLSAPTDFGVSAYRNLGNRSFSSATNTLPFFSSQGPNIVSVFANADTKIDVARSLVPDGFFNDDGLEVLRASGANGGSISFTADTSDHYLNGDLPQDISAADFNKDGRDDLAVLLTDGATVKILLSNGSNFTTPTSVNVGSVSSTKRMTVGDINRDAKVDVVVSNKEANSVSILIGNGNGTFKSPLVISLPASPNAVSLVDLDKDGDQDIVATPNTASGNGLAVIENTLCKTLIAEAEVSQQPVS